MSRPAASNPLDVCGVVVATCIGNAPKRRIQNVRRVTAIASKYVERNLNQRQIEDEATR
jgi:hypothetical protein